MNKEINSLIDKFLDKLKTLDSSINISKADLLIIIQDKKIREMLNCFIDNVNSKKELINLRFKMKFYMLNKNKIDKIHKLNKTKQELKELLNKKFSELSNLQEKTKFKINENLEINRNLTHMKKNEEKLFFNKLI